MTLNQHNLSVSVIIPTYNRSQLITKAIKSVYDQKGSYIKEVIIVDDGSTDNTEDVISNLIKDFPNNLIYSRKTNGGEASARNHGVKIASGKYIAFLDSDDIWLNTKLEQQMELFKNDPSLSLTFTAYTRISENGREVISLQNWSSSPEDVLKELIIRCSITPSTVVVKRDSLISVGLFDESFPLSCDWDMWVRLAANGHYMGYLDIPLAEYFWHTSNMSQDMRGIAKAALNIFLKLYKLEKLPTSIKKLEAACFARWNLNHACYSLEANNNKEARRYLLEAIRCHPSSFRVGWVKMYLQSLFVKK